MKTFSASLCRSKGKGLRLAPTASKVMWLFGHSVGVRLAG